MEQTIFLHMDNVRKITEESIKKIPEEIADIIPNGFNNNIRWNFGHIAYIQERIVFGFLNEEMMVPKDYEMLFAGRTKPSDWKVSPPSLEEIAAVLTEQNARIKDFMPGRFHEKLPTSYTNSAGVTFHTVGEAFLYSFYHEALHIEAIKHIYRSIKSK